MQHPIVAKKKRIGFLNIVEHRFLSKYVFVTTASLAYKRLAISCSQRESLARFSVIVVYYRPSSRRLWRRSGDEEWRITTGDPSADEQISISLICLSGYYVNKLNLFSLFEVRKLFSSNLEVLLVAFFVRTISDSGIFRVKIFWRRLELAEFEI